VASVSISRSSAELVEGESLTLTANVSPSDATEKTISWSSSKPSVASVDQKGTVNALSVGTAVIKASVGGKNDSCTITVISKTIEVSSITLDKSSLSLKIGEEYQLNATIVPSNASEKNVSWTSASSSIATVKDGLVKGVAAGETEITASCGGKKAVCRVKITPVEVESITLSKTELDLFVGDSETITASITPDNASDKQITWSSSDNRIATVSKGTITGVKEGNVIITAKAGSKTAECKVAVKNKGIPVSSLTLNKSVIYTVVDGIEQLEAKIYPSNATDSDVKWTCSNTAIASVSSKGRVVAKALGTATITAQAGNKQVSCEINVVPSNDPHVNYLTFEILAQGKIVLEYPSRDDLEYSKDFGKSWNLLPYRTDQGYRHYTPSVSIQCQAGETIMLRGLKEGKKANLDYEYGASTVFIGSTITANVSGNLLSVTNRDNFWDPSCQPYSKYDFWHSGGVFQGVKIISAKNLVFPKTEASLKSFFSDCEYLIEVPETIDTPLCVEGYAKMFSGCTHLKKAPRLPHTTMQEFCYAYMFDGCTSLETPPDLPATTLAQGCYNGMFNGCTRIKQAPTLPAKRMYYREYNYSYTTGGCYSHMFRGCTSLETAPDLPATILAENCYAGMFSGCTKLTTAPTLPATTMARYCYKGMFSGCTSLSSSPALASTQLAEGCYSGMFSGCTQLTKAPALPATTLAKYCYSSMFSGCKSLTSAPSLPATQLTEGCYTSLFTDCSNLSTAPELPALYLATNCYSNMFKGCSKIDYVKALFVIADKNCLTDWLEGTVRPSYGNNQPGTFIKNKDAYWTTAAEANIPSGWRLIDSE
jgi:uncharacterized protein YjdB